MDRPLRTGLTERERAIGQQVLKEIARPARVPRGRRAGLPDDRPDGVDAVGRRGAADPARDPDRVDADGRAVHPRRAVDRAPPARQREADRDADPPARPRQHRPRRRARRGDHPDGRLGAGHRARGRGARRRDRASGPLEAILGEPRSITGAFLRGERAVPDSAEAAPGQRQDARVKRRARAQPQEHRRDVPAGTFVAVTGVSGSGKSTLVTEVLYRALARELNGSREPAGRARRARRRRAHRQDHRDRPEPDRADAALQPGDVHRACSGRSANCSPACPESRVRGYKPGRFSFNVKGGRCENCKGDGILKIEMQFLPDVYVPCEVCKGKRYNREALEIHYKGRSIADVLEMTIEEALEFFQPVPTVRTKLQTLFDVGLGYVHLGQPATTLCGGEAQRVKLATELSRRATGRTLYVLDEPTTGLHFADVEKLLQVLHRLVDRATPCS